MTNLLNPFRFAAAAASLGPDTATSSTLSGFTKSGLTRPTDTWVKPACRNIWYNVGEARWDAVIPDNDHKVTKDITGTPSSVVTLDTRATSRPDCIWDESGGKLYVLFPHDDTTYIYRVDYDSGTDTYSTDAGFPVTITGVNIQQTGADDNHLNPMGFLRSPNGDLWVAVTASHKESAADKRIDVSKSTDNGATWSTAVNLDNTTEKGATTLGYFDDSGTVTVVLVSSQNAGAGIQAFSIDQDEDDLSSGNWTTETLPSAVGSETSDDHLASASYDDVLYVVRKTTTSSASEPLIELYVRDTGGWDQHTIVVGPDNSGDQGTRPSVIVDTDQAAVMVVWGENGGDERLMCKIEAIATLSSISSQAQIELIDDGSNWNRGLSLPRDTFDSSIGLVGISHFGVGSTIGQVEMEWT